MTFKSYVRFASKKSAPFQSLSYFPTQVADLYDFPKYTGKGCKIGFIELGGGYEKSDLQTFFNRLDLAVPTVTDRLVDGATNAPDGIDGAQGEVTLDIQVALAVAPDAEGLVYFAPNTNQGFLDAIKLAIHDKVDAISISWGGPEDQWSQEDLDSFNAVFASTKIPIFVAAGDNGSGDGERGQHVDFPGSSPHAISCGGTSLVGNVSTLGIQSETVWNDGTDGGATGGGFSSFFPRPSYQNEIGFTSNRGRGVPDIAGNADPDTGYNVFVAGQWLPIGGTSAVAPLMAALYCLLKEGSAAASSFFLGFLYEHAGSIRDINKGNNGAFKAATGWDPCTGLGVPNGEELLKNLVAAAKKGT